MDKYEKGKLRVLIKRILVEVGHKGASARELSNIINNDFYGFRNTISPYVISTLIRIDSKSPSKNCLDDVNVYVKNGRYVYSLFPKKDTGECLS